MGDAATKLKPGSGMRSDKVRMSAVVGTLIGAALVLTGCNSSPRRVTAFENLTSSSEYAKAWTVDEARRSVSGHSFLRNSPGRSNEALFFDPSGVVYQWVSGRADVASGTWSAEMRSARPSEMARTFLCLTFGDRTSATGPASPGATLNRCIDPSLLFIPASERARGDVFGIAGQAAAPGELGVERVRIEDVRRTVRSGA